MVLGRPSDREAIVGFTVPNAGTKMGNRPDTALRPCTSTWRTVSVVVPAVTDCVPIMGFPQAHERSFVTIARITNHSAYLIAYVKCS